MVKTTQLSMILSLAFLLLYAPVATCNGNEVPGDVAAEAFCHVYVDVNPNIAVNAMLPMIDMGGVQVGEIHGVVPFRIDANTERVRIWLATTRLYKGDQPDGVEVGPILFSWLTQGCEIYAESASPIGGADNHVDYISPLEIDGFPAFLTSALVFESAQNNHFSQEVDAVVHWYQNDPEKPMGEYSGRVRMLAEVVLPE